MVSFSVHWCVTIMISEVSGLYQPHIGLAMTSPSTACKALWRAASCLFILSSSWERRWLVQQTGVGGRVGAATRTLPSRPAPSPPAPRPAPLPEPGNPFTRPAANVAFPGQEDESPDVGYNNPRENE